ncbi:UNVERIFIED_CONTAM: hypothetical protein RMT77_015461 [Armadillidium vulgare]
MMKQYTVLLTVIILITLTYKSSHVMTEAVNPKVAESKLTSHGNLKSGNASDCCDSLSNIEADVEELQRENIVQEEELEQLRDSVVELQAEIEMLKNSFLELIEGEKKYKDLK